MSRELLSKLAAKSQNLTPLGGALEITWQDVALCLAGLPTAHSLWAMAAYSENDKAAKSLIKLLALKFTQTEDFIFAAMFEVIYPNHCKKCNGSGVVGIKNCDRCGGSGRVRMSDRKRAALMKQSRSYYKAREQVYNEVIAYLNTLDDQLVRHLAVKLGRIRVAV